MNIFPLRLALPQRATRTTRAMPPAIALKPRQTWSATVPAGQRVHCERGVIWLTQSGETTDFILRAGQSFVAPRRSHVVVQAISAQGAIFNLETNR